MAININHPENLIEGLSSLTLKSSSGQTITLNSDSGTINVSSSTINNLLDPTSLQDAATKNYVDTELANLNLTLDADTGLVGSVNIKAGTLTVNGTTYQIDTAINGSTITISLPTNLIAPGGLEVTNDLRVKGNSIFDGTITGNLTGQVSDISNHSTTNLAEGSNLYFTEARVKNTVSAGTGLTYTSASGEFKITDTGVTSGVYGDGSNIPVLTVNAQGQITSASTVAVAGVSNFQYDSTNGDLTINTADGNSFVATVDLNPFTTADLTEGSNLYYTDARARLAVSAGTGVYYDSATGVVSIGQQVDTTSDVVFNSVTVNGTLTSDDITSTNITVSGNATITGNLTVQGTTTSVNSTNTEIADNTLVLNKDETGAGISLLTSGIEVDRGTLDNTSWKYSELTNSWEAREGTNLTAITSAEIDAGNVNISGNTISATDPNGDLNLVSNGTGNVNINGQRVGTDADALMYAIVFGG
jgi:hypothetical protein